MHTPIARALLVAAALALLATAPAQASSGDVIRDCSEDGSLEGHYSQGELVGALDNLPSDIDEYTDCRTVIRRAQLAGAKGKGKGKPQGVVSRVDHSAPVNPERAAQHRSRDSRQVGAGAHRGLRDQARGDRGTVRRGWSRHRPSNLRPGGACRAWRRDGVGRRRVQRRWPTRGQTEAALR